MTPWPPELQDALAQRYVLRLLSPGAARRFDARLRRDAQLQAAVRRWEHHLAQLAAGVPPITPGPRVWRAIARRIRPAPAQRTNWLHDMARWARAALAPRVLTGVAAGMVASVLLLQQYPGLVGAEARRDGLPESYVGLLTDAQNQKAATLSSLRGSRRVELRLLQAVPHAVGERLALWGHGGPQGTVFLAWLPESRSATLVLDAATEKRLYASPRIGVSVEPPAMSGTPSDAAPQAPATAFVLDGHCIKFW